VLLLLLLLLLLPAQLAALIIHHKSLILGDHRPQLGDLVTDGLLLVIVLLVDDHVHGIAGGHCGVGLYQVHGMVVHRGNILLSVKIDYRYAKTTSVLVRICFK
jgi:hypothetical protein